MSKNTDFEKFSKPSIEIIQKKSRGWDHLLLVQILEEEIDEIDSWRAIKINPPEISIPISIENFDDLAKYLNKLNSNLKSIIEFKNVFQKFNANKASGNSKNDSDPMVIKMIAKEISIDYLKLTNQLEEITKERFNFSTFEHNTIKNNSEEYKLILAVIEPSFIMLKGYAEFFLNAIRRFIEFVRIKYSLTQDVLHENQPTPEITFKLVLPTFPSFVEALEKANKITNHSKNIKSKQRVLKADGAQKKPTTNNPLRKLAEEIALCETYNITDLKEVLLPLDYFPSAFIDAINDESINLMGDLAIEEVGNEILINKIAMNRVLKSESLFIIK